MHLVFDICELLAYIHRVSKNKRGPFFEIGIIQLFLRNLSKLLYGHNKMILLCSEEESKYSSTSARSAVIITSDCIYDNIVSS